MKEKYTFEHVKAYSIIAFYNWCNSGNRDNKSLKEFELFIQPLEKIHIKDNAVKYAEKLINKRI